MILSKRKLKDIMFHNHALDLNQTPSLILKSKAGDIVQIGVFQYEVGTNDSWYIGERIYLTRTDSNVNGLAGHKGVVKFSEFVKYLRARGTNGTNGAIVMTREEALNLIVSKTYAIG